MCPLDAQIKLCKGGIVMKGCRIAKAVLVLWGIVGLISALGSLIVQNGWIVTFLFFTSAIVCFSLAWIIEVLEYGP